MSLYQALSPRFLINDIRNLISQTPAGRSPAQILPRSLRNSLRVQPPGNGFEARQLLRFFDIHARDFLSGDETFRERDRADLLGEFAPDMVTVLGEEITFLVPDFLVVGCGACDGALGEEEKESAEIVHVHVVPFGETFAELGGLAFLESDADEVVDLSAALVSGAATGTVDGRGTDDGGFERGGAGGEDELVDVSVEGGVREMGEL